MKKIFVFLKKVKDILKFLLDLLKKKIKKFFSSKFFKVILIFAVVTFLFIVLTNVYILRSANSQIFYQTRDLPEYQTALLLGAKVYNNGALSFMMQDRADTTIEIYKAGKVKKILISGDHSTKGYDEVNTIKNYLIKNGIPEEDIFTDHAGLDTYDSVYRAKNIFEVESMIIVTQEFHLSRAVFIANKLEIKNVGIVGDRRDYCCMFWNYARESLARIKAFFNAVLSAQSKFLGEKIPITGDSKKSYD